METTHGNLTVKTTNSNIDITNGRVLIRLVHKDGGYVQEFCAVDKEGKFQLVLSSLHKNLIPSSEYRACTSPMISGNRPHLFSISRDSLRMVYSDAHITSHTEQSVVMLLTGSVMDHNLECRIELRENESSVHVTVEDNIETGISLPLVEYLMSSYAFIPARWAVTLGSNIDYTWAPILRPGDDQIIGDRAFYAPAVIVQHGRYAAALIPDPSVTNGTMRTALDIDVANGLLSSPLISYGFCEYEESNGSFVHDMTMAKRLKSLHLKYGYELLLDAGCKTKSIHRQLAKNLWEKSREWRADSGEQQNHAESSADLYSDKTVNLKNALLEPDAWAAYGVYSTGDAALKKGAHTLINALLTAPKYAGLFPTKFDREKRVWSGCNMTIDRAYYHSVECSRQCYWLLRWYMDFDQDSRIADYCKDYAEFLANVMHKDGSIPSFFDKYANPLPTLMHSSQTAISAFFLARMGSITRDNRYTQAAQKAAGFVIERKNDLYQGHTLIDTQNRLTKSIRDPHTGAPPQSGWALLWSAMACIEMYESVQDRKFIEQGISILDQLCMFQSVWEGCGSIPFGLCTKGNVDISADVELSAEFAECAMRYARATGEKHYFERGATALKAAMNMNNVSALSAARIAAIDAAIRRSFGLAFVHVGKKWAIPVNGAKVRNAQFGHGKLSLSVYDGHYGSYKVVFGGMRGKVYKLRINRCEITCSADEMQSGIQLPRP